MAHFDCSERFAAVSAWQILGRSSKELKSSAMSDISDVFLGITKNM